MAMAETQPPKPGIGARKPAYLVRRRSCAAKAQFPQRVADVSREALNANMLDAGDKTAHQA